MVRHAIQSRPCSYSRRPDSLEKRMERGREYSYDRGWSASFVDTDDKDIRSLGMAHARRGLSSLVHDVSFTRVLTQLAISCYVA